MPAPSAPTLPEPTLAQIFSYLDLPASSPAPTSPLALLRTSLPCLPHSLLLAFDGPTSPRERAAIPEIKARRIAWADGSAAIATPVQGPGARRRVLRWRAGKRRWPALWERMGGPGDPTELRRWEEEMGQGGADEDWDEDEDEDERGDEVFAERSFIPGQETVHHAPSIPVVGSDKSDAGPSSSDSISDAPAPPRSILAASAAQGSALPSARSGMNTTMHRGRFGAFLRSLEAEREGEEDARARRAEREFDRREEAAKEEFEDSESDEEDGEARVTVRRVQETRGQSRDEMERVIEAFEKRLLELFLDGLDSIPYAPIDFADPAVLPPNKLTAQDAEDRYFDEEEEGAAPALDARTAGELCAPERGERVAALSPANGSPLAEGEYDY